MTAPAPWPAPWPARCADSLGWSIPTLFVVTSLAVGLLPSLVILWAIFLGARDGAVIFDATVTVWINSGAVGYACALVVWTVRRTREDLQAAAERFDTDDIQALARDVIAAPGRRAIALSVIGGLIVFALLNLIFFDIRDQVRDPTPEQLLFAWGAPLFLLLWQSLFYCVTVMALITHRLGTVAERHLRVDLLDVDALAVIPAIGVRLTLAAVIGLGLIPVQAVLTQDLNLFDWLPPLVLVTVFGAWTLLRPLFGTHRAITCAKAAELGRVHAALAACGAPDLDRITDERFARLLLWRNTVLDASEWPLSRSSVARLLFYVVIPPAAWLAAVLTEVTLENLL